MGVSSIFPKPSIILIPARYRMAEFALLFKTVHIIADLGDMDIGAQYTELAVASLKPAANCLSCVTGSSDILTSHSETAESVEICTQL